MRAYVLVFVGGGMGAALRHGINVAFGRWFGTSFPFHTLFENISGSTVMGLLVSYFVMTGGTSQSLRLFLATGILGGLYTRFSRREDEQHQEDELDLGLARASADPLEQPGHDPRQRREHGDRDHGESEQVDVVVGEDQAERHHVCLLFVSTVLLIERHQYGLASIYDG